MKMKKKKNNNNNKKKGTDLKGAMIHNVFT
jgi:hypothetical protein